MYIYILRGIYIYIYIYTYIPLRCYTAAEAGVRGIQTYADVCCCGLTDVRGRMLLWTYRRILTYAPVYVLYCCFTTALLLYMDLRY